jgi:hypothetical protein
MVLDVQKLATGDLLEHYRKTVYRLGRDGSRFDARDQSLADRLEEEILRRMAW